MSQVHVSAPPETNTAAEIRAEHELLRNLLARLVSTRDVALLAELAGKLQDLLEVHFEREERADGVTRDVTANAPHRVKALQAVLAEHDALFESARRLAEDARACLDGPIAALFNDAHALSETLHAHEARENEIFIDAIYVDYGTGD